MNLLRYTTYRKKMKKYRFLKIGEKIKLDDEFLNRYLQKWIPTQSVGHKVVERNHGQYRRRIIKKNQHPHTTLFA